MTAPSIPSINSTSSTAPRAGVARGSHTLPSMRHDNTGPEMSCASSIKSVLDSGNVCPGYELSCTSGPVYASAPLVQVHPGGVLASVLSGLWSRHQPRGP